MEPIHIFYNELSTDKKKVDLAEKNEIEEVKFKTSREYALTGLSINQDLHSKVIAVTDNDRLETMDNLIEMKKLY